MSRDEVVFLVIGGPGEVVPAMLPNLVLELQAQMDYRDCPEIELDYTRECMELVREYEALEEIKPRPPDGRWAKEIYKPPNLPQIRHGAGLSLGGVPP